MEVNQGCFNSQNIKDRLKSLTGHSRSSLNQGVSDVHGYKGPPLPGTMMTFWASLIISTVWSTLTSVWVPVISMGLPVPVDDVP